MKQLLLKLAFSLPVQLLVLHVKKNQLLLVCWALLFLIINGQFAKGLGIPYLFVTPEYLYTVDFFSFFVVGLTLGGFIVAFHIASYILDSNRFPFLGSISRPFTKFSLNNSLIPLAFIINYTFCIVNYQAYYEYEDGLSIINLVLGLYAGITLSLILFYTYFKYTNKDIFKVLAERVEKRIKRVKVTRVGAIKRHKEQKYSRIKVSYFIDLSFRARKAEFKSNERFGNTIKGIFDQNHLNSVIAELFIFVVIFVLGIFRDTPAFQIPAAASAVLFITIFIMFTGAISYWFRGWSLTFAIAFIFLVNFLVQLDWFAKTHHAYGLDYDKEPVDYSVENIRSIGTDAIIKEDKANTLRILENWRAKFDEKPKMILLGASGGGQRAAYWTMNALQVVDSMTNGALFENTMAITGASGGLIGAGYYRELKLRKVKGERIALHEAKYLDNIGKDALNPIIFSLLTNDVFIRYQSFEYNGFDYPKDRGYAFEQQLNSNTEGVLEKKLSDYKEPELNALIPMLFLAPTSVNDGRKVYVSPHSLSYMGENTIALDSVADLQNRSIDFRRLFAEYGADDLRFLTALRMSASFPYITPNIQLPSEPMLEIMDAGLADNFGVSDAIVFLHHFQDWIKENTSGVVLLSIRDSYKEPEINVQENQTVFEKLFTPISNVYNNWSNIQDIRNDLLIEYAKEWYDGPLNHLVISYDADLSQYDKPEDKLKHITERASLNWRLTGREKANIKESIWSDRNQLTIERLRLLLGQE